MNPLRVLIADEDERHLESLERVLAALGHEVAAHAVDPRQAAELIAASDPAVALVALHRDHDHALNLIEEIGEYASGPVIAVIESADAGFVSRAAERGIYAYAHPLTPESVQGAMEVAVRRHAEVEALEERVDALEGALERRAVIERAKGILMERHALGERAAFERLRDHARANGRKVADLAAAIVEGHPLLPRSPGEAPDAPR